MAMTIIVTNNVEDRYRGLILSCLPEIAPGVYVTVGLDKGARSRLWEILSEWYSQLGNGSIIMISPDKGEPSGLRISSLGEPIKELVDFGGIIVSMRRR